MQEITWESAGDELFALTDGTGYPVVMYHGVAGTHEQSQLLLGPLARSVHLIAPDIRGRGRSNCAHAEHHTWDQYAADHVAMLDTLGIEIACVAGGSFGSGLALAVAMRYPHRLSAMVLISPVFLGNEYGFLPEQHEAFATDKVLNLAASVEKRGLRAAVDEFVGDLEPTSISAHKRRELLTHDEASLCAAIRAFTTNGHPFDQLSQLCELTIPVLVFSGADRLHNPRVGIEYVRYLPNACEAKTSLWSHAGTLANAPLPNAWTRQDTGQDGREHISELFAPLSQQLVDQTNAFLTAKLAPFGK